MTNRLLLDKTQGIMRLFAADRSEGQIAWTLDIDRKLVDSELRSQGAKEPKRPPGPWPINSNENASRKAPIFWLKRFRSKEALSVAPFNSPNNR